MKDYAIDSNIRDRIHNTIFIISMALAVVISALFNLCTESMAKNSFWFVFLNLFIFPGMGIINTFLKWLFDSHLWHSNVFKKIVKIPDLSGVWEITAQNKDGIEYSGTLKIKQTFTQISICGKFKNSSSYNTATFITALPDGISLSYYYTNEPDGTIQTMGIHHGFAVILFSEDCETVKGSYFNDNFRGTQGYWQLQKSA